jgi:hypothetical protein
VDGMNWRRCWGVKIRGIGSRFRRCSWGRLPRAFNSFPSIRVIAQKQRDRYACANTIVTKKWISFPLFVLPGCEFKKAKTYSTYRFVTGNQARGPTVSARQIRTSKNQTVQDQREFDQQGDAVFPIYLRFGRKVYSAISIPQQELRG